MAFQLSLRPQTLTKLRRIRPLSSSTPPDSIPDPSSAAIPDPSSAAAPPPSFDSHLRDIKDHELEEKELDSMMGGMTFRGLWESLWRLKEDDLKKKAATSSDRLLAFIPKPPQDELLEKFKMERELQKVRDKFKMELERELQKVRDKFKMELELELQKVRDKFKMSESDCGSTRVQEVGNKPSSQSVLNAILTDEKSTDDAKPKDPKTEFLPMYSYKELEEKLRRIRPEVGDNWFSIAELNDQLVKLYELEEKGLDSVMGGEDCRVLRESLLRVTEADLKKKAAASLNRLSAIMSKHPKDELLETFKMKLEMKLEFQKVREEFKMSDKQARKRLNEMVQKRKELLTDLFWTDRVSYFVLLLEIGLFDSPEYKASIFWDQN